MKFFVLALLAVGVSALPSQLPLSGGYQSNSYGSSSGYSSSGLASSGKVAKYQTSGALLGSGYGSGYNSGAQVYGYGAGNAQNIALVQAVPATQTVGLISGGLQNVGVQKVGVIGVASGLTGVSAGLAGGLYNRQNVAQYSVGQQQGFADRHQLLSNFNSHSRQEVVPAAVQTVDHTIEYRTVASNQVQAVPQTIDIEPSNVPVHLNFKTKSSDVLVSQQHQAGEPVQVTDSSADEPSRLYYNIDKPVVQYVNEQITPYRQITQEISPVVQKVHTVVTRGEEHANQAQAVQSVQSVQSAQSGALRSAAPIAVAAVPAYTQQYETVQRQAVVQPIGVSTGYIAAAAQPTYQAYQIAQPSYQIAQPSYQTVQPSYQTVQVAQPIAVSSGNYAQNAGQLSTVNLVQEPASTYQIQIQPASASYETLSANKLGQLSSGLTSSSLFSNSQQY